MARDERSQFLAELKKDAAALAASAKKPPSSGFLTDEEVLAKLGIEDDETRVTLNAKLSRVRYGLDKNKNKYFSFRFLVTDADHKGLPLDVFFGLNPDNERSYEITCDRLLGYLQSLGYDTLNWKKTEIVAKIVDAADELTASKPTAVVTVSAYERQNGDLSMNVYILSSSPDEASEDADEDAEDEAPTPKKAPAKKAARKAPAASPKATPKKGKKAPEPEPEGEEYEEVEDEEDPELESEAWSDWVGYSAMFDNGDGDEEVTLTEWDEKSGLFTIEDSEGLLYEVAPEDLTFPEE